jgi:hypothetical protein
MVNDIYASEIDEIIHSILYSWRYNPKGEFGVLYLSVSPECAYREKLKQVSGRRQDLLPQVVGNFRVNLAKCLDLTNPSILKKIDISKEQLIIPFDFSITQVLAREARNLGFEAIIAPSAIGEDCSTLVVFKDKLNPPSCCILDEKSVHPYP